MSTQKKKTGPKMVFLEDGIQFVDGGGYEHRKRATSQIISNTEREQNQ